jgi:hypothetical protein
MTATRTGAVTYAVIKSYAIGGIGGPDVWRKLLTPALRRAVVADAILSKLYARDNSPRELLITLTEQLNTDEEFS